MWQHLNESWIFVMMNGHRQMSNKNCHENDWTNFDGFERESHLLINRKRSFDSFLSLNLTGHHHEDQQKNSLISLLSINVFIYADKKCRQLYNVMLLTCKVRMLSKLPHHHQFSSSYHWVMWILRWCLFDS